MRLIFRSKHWNTTFSELTAKLVFLEEDVECYEIDELKGTIRRVF